jgi:hypothetical protein
MSPRIKEPQTALRMTEADRALAANLTHAKRLRGWTNETLASAMGRPDATGRNWVQERCSGRRPCTWGQLVALANALRIPTDVLTKGRTAILLYLSEHPELR